MFSTSMHMIYGRDRAVYVNPTSILLDRSNRDRRELVGGTLAASVRSDHGQQLQR